MSGVTFTLDLELTEAKAGLRAYQTLGQRTGPLMDRIGQLLEGSTVERFESGTAPDGHAWPVSRRAAADGGKTLVEHGHLRDSITHNLISDDAVEVGSNLVYAPIHQEGGTIQAKNGYLKFSFGNGAGRGFAQVKSVTLPARPYLGLSAEDERDVYDVVGSAMVDAWIRRRAA